MSRYRFTVGINIVTKRINYRYSEDKMSVRHARKIFVCTDIITKANCCTLTKTTESQRSERIRLVSVVISEVCKGVLMLCSNKQL